MIKGNQHFIALAKEIIADYMMSHFDKTDHASATMDDVYPVWICKTLQNYKGMFSTTFSDGMYYEVTYNGDKDELYLDAYKKWENKCYQHPAEEFQV